MGIFSPTDLERKGSPTIKRAMDILVSACALIVFSPLFAALILIVKSDGGPAFYGQQRISQNGKTFRCWKFRSMVTNADKVLEKLLAESAEARAEWDRDFKLKNDPRITRIGNILRKTSLDELPQLFNVLCGEMSIVGPRPITKAEMGYYNENIKQYLAVNPGITGLWQVSGRNDVSYDERVAMDVEYVNNWSLLLDLRIMLKTMKVMVARSGAY